ncbi:carboxymuconolactone decarboxylase family protein [Terricaulis sp.]|uniref:carboxymuconolactone decarboxylase family protein n=1 Tax=Terricaulis sp. TaxID=2768686 RepID=UPI0037830FC5
MEQRMKAPAAVLPGAWEGIQGLNKAVAKGDVPASVLQLTHLRASQINGCAACLDGAIKHTREAGLSDAQLFTVAGWRDSPHFSDAERAALNLTEAMTRLADRGDVPDDIWNEAAKHFEERALAALVLSIALSNFYNRLNVTTRQIYTGQW